MLALGIGACIWKERRHKLGSLILKSSSGVFCKLCHQRTVAGSFWEEFGVQSSLTQRVDVARGDSGEGGRARARGRLRGCGEQRLAEGTRSVAWAGWRGEGR